MSEGGRFPWKVQKLKRVPTTDYRNMTLHDPPEGWAWTHNSVTREWTLRELESASTAIPTVTSIVVEGEGEQLPDAKPVFCSEGTSFEGIPIAHVEAITTTECIHRHPVMESDTFQGICLRYKVTPTQLRQANGFSGTNLRLAPSVLKIPFSIKASKATASEIAALERVEEQEKIAGVARACGGLSTRECRAYLTMNDWNVQQAIANATDDLDFENNATSSNASALPMSPFY